MNTLDKDHELVRRAKVGEAEAIAELVSYHGGYIRNLAARYLQPWVDFDDLVQEGIVGLLFAVSKFKPELGYLFLTYAGHWVRHHIIDAARPNRGDDYIATGDLEYVESAEHSTQTKENHGEVLRALVTLDKRAREILERRYYAEVPESYTKIGKQMGGSREWVRLVEARALEKLRQTILEAA